MAKCQFGRSSIDFLGHHITQHGATPLTDKVEAIINFRQPATVKGLQWFVGMVNFYLLFIPSAARIMEPLFSALSGKANSLKLLVWTNDTLRAFQDAKTALIESTMLAHAREQALIALTTDASGEAIGVVLEQLVHGVWQPLAFFSKHLRLAERKYSGFDREILSLYLEIHHFRYFLEGRTFTAYTDHKPLTFCMSKLLDPWTSRQQRHITYISEFTTDIKQVQRKHNHVANTLSRATINFIHEGVDFEGMAANQKVDPEVQAYCTVEPQ